MKRIARPAKKKILVALLGACVVASSYSTSFASQSQPTTAKAAVQSGTSTPSTAVLGPPVTTTPSGPAEPQNIWWFSPFWPIYFYYYCYCPYYYYYYYYYYNFVIFGP